MTAGRRLVVAVAVLCALTRSAQARTARKPRARPNATTTAFPRAVPRAILPVIAGTDTTVLSRPGPFAVGVRTVAIPGSSAEVWYPVAPGTTGTQASYEMKMWLPLSAQQRLGTIAGPVFATTALRDAMPASAPGGPFPAVIFSHGFGGYRLQSSFLTIHLASWGFVVAAPDHPDRNLAAVLGGSFGFASKDVDDLRATVRALTELNVSGDLAGRIDLANLTAVGHSAGANTVLRWASSDESVRGVVALAGGAPSLFGAVTTGLQPTLYMSGANDQVISAPSIAAAYAASKAPKRLIALARSGHLAFADVCSVARDEGGLLAAAAKLGVSVPAALRTLGTDGCDPPNAPVEQAWPIIELAVTAQLRTVLGAGIPGFGLDQRTLDALSTAGAVKSTFQIG